MNTEQNIQTVQAFFAAVGSGDADAVLGLVAEDIEWIIPGEDWPLAGTYRGHAGVAGALRKASEEVSISYPEDPEFVAQGERVLVIGFAQGTINATGKTFDDRFVFAITVTNGKLASIREYVDTQALALAAAPQNAAEPPADRSDLRAS